MLKVQRPEKKFGKMIMTLYVTSVCNLACKECIMQHIMKHDNKYHMGLEELRDFLDLSEKSGYRFDFLLSGGEPLLWKNLDEGLRMLRASKVAKSITMFSNAMFHERVTQEVIDLVDVIRISHYFYNDKQIDELKAKWPLKVKVVERQGFYRNPTVAVPESVALPVVCMNAEFMYYNRFVYACAHAVSLAIHAKATVPIGKPLQQDYLDGMLEIKKGQAKEICTWCISNRPVRDYVEKVVNKSKGRDDISQWGYNEDFYAANSNLVRPDQLVELKINGKSPTKFLG